MSVLGYAFQAFRRLYRYLLVRSERVVPEKLLYLDGKEYELAQVIGRGTFGLVRRCVDREDQKDYAVKNVALNESNRMEATSFMRNERDVLDRLKGHPNIIEYHHFVETPRNILLVLSFVPGGNLFKMITSTGPIREDYAQTLFEQIAQGITWMHAQNVVHRDIKPENILLTERSLAEAQVKICDFGLSKILQTSDSSDDTSSHQMVMKTACGSRFYAAPEVIKRQAYSKAIDSWGLGIVLFAMITGQLPFDSVEDLKAVNFQGKLDLPVW